MNLVRRTRKTMAEKQNPVTLRKNKTARKLEWSRRKREAVIWDLLSSSSNDGTAKKKKWSSGKT